MPSYPNPLGLTGRRRYRKGWFGKLILQVEQAERIAYSVSDDPSDVTTLIWRDGVVGDINFLNWYDRDKAAKAAGLPPPAPPEHYATI